MHVVGCQAEEGCVLSLDMGATQISTSMYQVPYQVRTWVPGNFVVAQQQWTQAVRYEYVRGTGYARTWYLRVYEVRTSYEYFSSDN